MKNVGRISYTNKHKIGTMIVSVVTYYLIKFTNRGKKDKFYPKLMNLVRRDTICKKNLKPCLAELNFLKKI